MTCKKHSANALFTLGTGALLAASLAPLSANAATTLYVEKWAPESALSCTAVEPCNEISKALAVALPGSEILVGPGQYEESLTIVTEGLTLKSTHGQEVTQILPQVSRLAVPTITVAADNVQLGSVELGALNQGFLVKAEDAPAIQVGIRSQQCSFSRLHNAYLQDLRTSQPVSQVTIQGNKIVTEMTPFSQFPLEQQLCNPVDGTMLTQEFLPALDIHGMQAEVISNKIETQGTHAAVIDALQVVVEKNVVKFQPELEIDLLTHGAMYIPSHVSGMIKENMVQDLRPEGLWGIGGYGISTLGQQTSLIQNTVKGFRVGMVTPQVELIEQNTVLQPNLFGIQATEVEMIKNNMIAFDGGQGRGAIGMMLEKMENALVSNNTIMEMGSFAIQLDNEEALQPMIGIMENNIIRNSMQNGQCGIFIENPGPQTLVLQDNWYGDLTNPAQREILVEIASFQDLEGMTRYEFETPLLPGDHICTLSSLVDASGMLPTVSITPSLIPNQQEVVQGEVEEPVRGEVVQQRDEVVQEGQFVIQQRTVRQ